MHDEWDNLLVDDLRLRLGDAYDVRYPRMPHEDDPSLVTWGPAIRDALTALPPGSVVVAHSVGATILLQTLVEDPVDLGALVLIAPPYVGEGGWPGEEFAFDARLGERLPESVDLVWGTADDTVPAAHVDLFARAVPQARVHRLEGLDHQLGNDMSEVARRVCATAEH